MIKNSTTSHLHAFILAATVGLAAGCTSNAAIEETRLDAQRALQEAQEARQIAEQALEAALAAQQSADAAQNCCTEHQEQLDRALERMQQK